MKRVANAIARWYKGEYVPPANDPHGLLIVMQGRQRYHWSARAARCLARFYREHWKWLWVFLVSVAGLIAALKKL